MSYAGKRVLIVGLGESGRAAARFFASRGARLAATDARRREQLEAVAAELEALDVELELGGHPNELFLGQDLIVPSPGVPWNLPQLEAARAAGVETAGELEIAAGELRGRVIGVTGSNGKTTTTALIGHLLAAGGLEVVVAGNIGTPVLSIVEDSRDEQWSVLELSSFQLEAMRSFRCHIAAALNVTPDHLDRHGTFRAYADAKRRIFEPQRLEDAAVLNADDPACRECASAAPGRVVWFSRRQRLDAGAWAADGSIWLDGRRLRSTDLPIRGAHNLENALAAAAAASSAGLSDEAIAEGLGSFQPVEHRLEFVRSIAGVDYYNDSKATNVDAAVKAIESFDRGLWLILGGRDKQSDYTALEAPLANRLRKILAIGEAAELIERQFDGRLPLERCGALAAAVRRAREQAAPGDVVLLSPACASFDQFENYGARGREFKRLVGELSE